MSKSNLQSGSEIRPLTGVRGLAACLVAAYHVGTSPFYGAWYLPLTITAT